MLVTLSVRWSHDKVTCYINQFMRLWYLRICKQPNLRRCASMRSHHGRRFWHTQSRDVGFKTKLLASKPNYTTLTNFSTSYLVMCKVYTGVDGIKQLYHVCPPVRKIIHSLKLVDYLHVQADNPWYYYYL